MLVSLLFATIPGPNGCGKSTLLRLVMGQEDPISGRVQLGPHNIVPAYFAQNQADALDLQQSVLQTMVKAAPDAQLNDVKALLGRMMFNSKAMEKKVCTARPSPHHGSRLVGAHLSMLHGQLGNVGVCLALLQDACLAPLEWYN